MKITSGMFLQINDLRTSDFVRERPSVYQANVENTWQRYHYTDGSSNKFWEIRVNGTCHEVKFGRIGTVGQVRSKEHISVAMARAEMRKLINSKLNKGYVAQGTVAAIAPVVLEQPRETTTRWVIVRTVKSIRQRPVPIFMCKIIDASNRSNVGVNKEIEFGSDINCTLLRKCGSCNELYSNDQNACEACMDLVPEELLQLTRDELIERLASKSISMEQQKLAVSLLETGTLSQSNWHAMPYDVENNADDFVVEKPKPQVTEATVVKEDVGLKTTKKKEKQNEEYELITQLVNGEQTCDIYLHDKQYKIVMNGDKVFTKSFSKESVARGAISMLIASRKAVGYVEKQEDIEDQAN